MTTSGCGPGDLSNPRNRTRLETQAVLLPTPRASVNENRQTKRTPSQEAGTHGKNLAAEVCELLPTPMAADSQRESDTFARGNPTLKGALLPTPRASDGAKGGPNQRGSSGDLTLPSAAAKLLPTPAASNPNDGEDLENWEARRQRNLAKKVNGNGQGTPLSVAVRLLPTPTTQAHSRNRTANRNAPKDSTNTQSSTLLDVFWTGETTDPPSPDGSP